MTVSGITQATSKMKQEHFTLVGRDIRVVFLFFSFFLAEIFSSITALECSNDGLCSVVINGGTQFLPKQIIARRISLVPVLRHRKMIVMIKIIVVLVLWKHTDHECLGLLMNGLESSVCRKFYTE